MYNHLSRDDRITIHVLQGEDLSPGEIAERMDVCRSTIYRELKRCPAGAYDPDIAHRHAAKKRRRASCVPRKMTGDAWQQCLAGLRRHRSVWSAAQAEGFPVCATTFYMHLGRAACLGSHMKPPRPRRKKMMREPFVWMSYGPGRYRKRPKGAGFAAMRDAAPIAERAAIAELLVEDGHWEVDTMHWPGGAMSLTLRERRSGVVLLGVLPERSAAAAAKIIIRMLRDLPVKTITSDGGSEFARWRLVEKALGAKWYVCDPGCPQQRGGVEHANGIVRRLVRADIPKCGLKAALRLAQRVINYRPTQRLQARLPAEVLGL